MSDTIHHMDKPSEALADPAVGFFWEWAGWSYNPRTQTPEQGRLECARALAQAERRGSDEGLSFEWDIDPEIDSSEFDDSDEPWQLWTCVCRNASGKAVASLCGIDFGRDGEPWGDNYRRVVEAEMAYESLD